jgi:hypothetical protein
MDVKRINSEIARGAGALAEAVEAFSAARKLIGEADCHPSLDTTLDCLVAAATEIPDEYWGILLAFRHVGIDEIRARLGAAVGEALR